MDETYADKLRAIANKLDEQCKEANLEPLGSPKQRNAVIEAQSEAMGELFAVLWVMYREAARKAASL